MSTVRGQLLVAAPTLRDPNFSETVVLVIEHNADGALGLVLNRPSSTPPPAGLEAWTTLVAAPSDLFAGGPVEESALLGLITTPEGDGFLLADLSELPDPALGDGSVRLFRGYSGWGPGQLEGELAMGGWLVLGADASDVIDPHPEKLWAKVLRRQGGLVALLATYPTRPFLN